MNKTILINDIELKLSNLDKVIFPKSNITKSQLIKYYSDIFCYTSQFLYNYPATLHRFPDGIDKPGFYQKDISRYHAKWMDVAKVKNKTNDKIVEYILVNNKESLIYIANLASIEVHTWLSKYDKPDYPTKIIWDLDPYNNNFESVVLAALELKKILEDKNLNPYVMTSGSLGLHVIIFLSKDLNNLIDYLKIDSSDIHNINNVIDYDKAIDFAQECAQDLINKFPEHFTMEIRKDKRDKKLFIDILRNRSIATSIAPYSVRARENAPIAAPISWKEVNNSLSSQKYDIKNIFEKLKTEGNPWADLY